MLKQRREKHDVKINLQRCSFIERKNTRKFHSFVVFDKCSMIFQIDISIKLPGYIEQKENVCNDMISSSLFGKEDSSLYVYIY